MSTLPVGASFQLLNEGASGGIFRESYLYPEGLRPGVYPRRTVPSRSRAE